MVDVEVLLALMRVVRFLYSSIEFFARLVAALQTRHILKRYSIHQLLQHRERILFDVRYRVLTVELYCIAQEIGLDVLCVREVDAASYRFFFRRSKRRVAPTRCCR